METKLKTFSEIREMKFKNADERMDYMITEICNYRFMLQKELNTIILNRYQEMVDNHLKLNK